MSSVLFKVLSIFCFHDYHSSSSFRQQFFCFSDNFFINRTLLSWRKLTVYTLFLYRTHFFTFFFMLSTWFSFSRFLFFSGVIVRLCVFLAYPFHGFVLCIDFFESFCNMCVLHFGFVMIFTERWILLGLCIRSNEVYKVTREIWSFIGLITCILENWNSLPNWTTEQVLDI